MPTEHHCDAKASPTRLRFITGRFLERDDEFADLSTGPTSTRAQASGAVLARGKNHCLDTEMDGWSSGFQKGNQCGNAKIPHSFIWPAGAT